jgi:hypothetical protein
MMHNEIKIFLIILCLLLGITTIGVTQPPPPPEPAIVVTDSSAPADDLQILFRSITEGNTSDRTVTVSNAGNASLVIGDIAQVNAPFSIVSDNCSGQSITPLDTCTLTVRFSPTAAGTFSDAIDISSNDSDESSITIDVSGTGLSLLSNNPPSAPQQISPADGQTNTETAVEFKWEKSTDSDGGNVTYDLYVCEDENFTVGCITEEDIASLGRKDVYYAGMGSSGALLMLFGIVAVLTGDVRGRRKISVLIVVTGMVGLLLVSCGGGGGGSVGSGVPSDDTGVTNEISHTASGLSGGTTYYWKVVARDDKGEETNSSVWSLDTR